MKQKIDELVAKLKNDLPKVKVSCLRTKHSKAHYYLEVEIPFKVFLQSQYRNRGHLGIYSFIYREMNPIIASVVESFGLRKFVRILYHCDNVFVLLSSKNILHKIKERRDILIFSHGDGIHDLNSENYRDRDYNINGVFLNIISFAHYLTETPI
ncbi:MAG: hypothetical protein IJ660_01135 [Alphaproteobacteria bacterium]|nr:hypothetical protein [Alphaproteobacteria bacterium]